ncbi:MAG: hypothetical protein RI964_1946 [Pseudomonadota bacterium]
MFSRIQGFHMNKSVVTMLSGIAIALSCVITIADTFIDHPLQIAQASQLSSSSSQKELPSRLYEFPNAGESVAKTQLPAELLNKIPTHELIQLWLEYPHLETVQSAPQQGMAELRSSFNGLQTLLQRKDAADKLLSVLRHQQLDDFKTVMNDANLQQFSQRQTALTALMAQPEMLAQLPAYQRYYLKRLTTQRLEAMKSIPQLANSPAFIAYQALLGKLSKNNLKS